nr:MAG TPA: hypothetical protein [Caudoviricetes sp.]
MSESQDLSRRNPAIFLTFFQGRKPLGSSIRGIRLTTGDAYEVGIHQRDMGF